MASLICNQPEKMCLFLVNLMKIKRVLKYSHWNYVFYDIALYLVLLLVFNTFQHSLKMLIKWGFLAFFLFALSLTSIKVLGMSCIICI